MACLSTWFLKKRGTAMGIMVTGSSLGGIVFPIMIGRMIPTIGFPWTIRTAAFIILALQIIAIFTLRPRTKPVPKRMPVGRFAAPFRELPFIMMLIGFFLLTYGIFVPITYLAVQGFQEAHLSEEMAQYLVAIFNAARLATPSSHPLKHRSAEPLTIHPSYSLFGRLFAGYSADKLGPWNIFIVFCTLSGISGFAVWIPAKSPSIVIGFTIMFGFVSGAFIGLLGAVVVAVSPIPEMGYRMGILFLAMSIPALTLAPIGGAILAHAEDAWLSMKVFSGVMCLTGSAFVLVARLLYTDMKLLKKF